MQPARPPPRAQGSFSPLPNGIASGDLSRPRARRVESSSSDDSTPLTLPKARGPGTQQQQGGTPIYAAFTQHPNSSASSLHNFSRPTPALTLSTAATAARQVAIGVDSPRTASPLNPPSAGPRGHVRKHSQNAGFFDSTLPSTSTSNLSQVSLGQSMGPPQHRELSASHIAAQAAVMNHQTQQQQHTRQRSQTVPAHGESYESTSSTIKRVSGGPLSPPMLSLTEASGPRDSGFGNQGYHNGLYGSHAAAAQAAANVAFPRSGPASPSIQTQIQMPPPPPPPPPMPERKPEKSKMKLFSRPGKIGTKGEPKEKPLPSPSKIGSALASLQRGNFSTTSLDSTAQSFYSLANSSSATIRAVETPIEREGKEKEKKHHFLSRQKHKLKDKEDQHLPLSSAASNSRPSDPSAPSSLYNFNLPPSPGPHSSTFKSMSGLDLRHGGRAYREKKKEEKYDPTESTLTLASDWTGASSLNSASQSSVFLHEPLDSGKLGLNSMSYDDAWPYLKAKLLVVFEGEDLRLPVEDFNRVVMMHIQYCVQRRSPNIILDDLRELLSTGFSSLDRTLRQYPEDRMIPVLVELWLFTFTSILPYLQAVFLPLDLEFTGNGSQWTAWLANQRLPRGVGTRCPSACSHLVPRHRDTTPLRDAQGHVLTAVARVPSAVSRKHGARVAATHSSDARAPAVRPAAARLSFNLTRRRLGRLIPAPGHSYESRPQRGQLQ
jgi:hypothetical protein